MTDIIKVQRPIAPQFGEWLAYAKGRMNMRLFTPDCGTKGQMGDDLKAFFRANFADGRWHIGDRVPDENW